MREAIKYFDILELDYLDICHGFSLHKGIVVFWEINNVEKYILKFIDATPSHIAKNLAAVHVAWNIATSELIDMPKQFRDHHEKDIQCLKNHLTKRQAKEINIDKYELYGIRLLWHEEPKCGAYKTGKVIEIGGAFLYIFSTVIGVDEQ